MTPKRHTSKVTLLLFNDFYGFGTLQALYQGLMSWMVTVKVLDLRPLVGIPFIYHSCFLPNKAATSTLVDNVTYFLSYFLSYCISYFFCILIATRQRETAGEWGTKVASSFWLS